MVGVAVKVTDVPEHIVEEGIEITIEGVTSGFTVMVIPELVTLVAVLHDALEVSTQRIMSPVTKLVPAVATYVTEFAEDILVPFFVHWYEGPAPPPEVLAVKVTEVPVHTVLLAVEIVIVGVTADTTVIFTEDTLLLQGLLAIVHLNLYVPTPAAGVKVALLAVKLLS